MDKNGDLLFRPQDMWIGCSTPSPSTITDNFKCVRPAMSSSPLTTRKICNLIIDCFIIFRCATLPCWRWKRNCQFEIRSRKKVGRKRAHRITPSPTPINSLKNEINLKLIVKRESTNEAMMMIWITLIWKEKVTFSFSGKNSSPYCLCGCLHLPDYCDYVSQGYHTDLYWSHLNCLCNFKEKFHAVTISVWLSKGLLISSM